MKEINFYCNTFDRIENAQIKKGIVLYFIFFFFIFQTSAQKQNYNWYFGNKASISFQNAIPTGLNSSKMASIEGCASVSDPATGKLLFYTNGIQVWNAKNEIMPSGDGLLAGANTSSTQGVVIVPYPRKKNKYYIITTDEANQSNNGLRYSIVDMELDKGFGDIVPSEKNILINSNTTERISVTKNGNNSGYWIVIHEKNNNCYKSFELTDSGLNTNAVISKIGSTHSIIPKDNGDATMGYMKFSSNGSNLAVAIFADNKIEIFDFDKCTGKLSNVHVVNTTDNPYGIEFSPDNTKLYFSLYSQTYFQGLIYQLNLNDFGSNARIVGLSSSINFQSVGALQLAPDSKIYVAINSESWLSAINYPNNLGSACDFIDKSISLPKIDLFPTTGILGLPPLVPDLIPDYPSDIPRIVTRNNCLNEDAYFEINTSRNIKSIYWDFGDTLSGLNNSSNSVSPYHKFSSTGKFDVRAILSTYCSVDTVKKIVIIKNCDTTSIDCQIFFPNAFTPNGDEKNDKFGPVTNCKLDEYEFMIINKWGEIIYKSKDISESWTGIYHGLDCPVGVYIYLMKFKTSNQQLKSQFGNVMLLR